MTSGAIGTMSGKTRRIVTTHAIATRVGERTAIATREIVCHARDREYTLRHIREPAATTATVGAFRVVPARDLGDYADRLADPPTGTSDTSGNRPSSRRFASLATASRVVVLTDRGRNLRKADRDRERSHEQTFYMGLRRERELEHNAQLYWPCLGEAARLEACGARINRDA